MIALHDGDNTKFPNIVLMKMATYFKSLNTSYEIYSEDNHEKYDGIISSKVFTFTENNLKIINDPKTLKGGTGYNIKTKLPFDIEHICPDYSLYNINYSVGFTTRGCPNKCSWCIVPEKEGDIKAHADIDEFTRHNNLILMDNNILAHKHGLKQLEKIANKKIKLDCNQGLDARLIDNIMAQLLSKIKWYKPIRLACDSMSQMEDIAKAVKNLRYNNCTPRTYFVYVLVKEDIQDALERIKFLKYLNLDPFAQPYRDFKTNKEPSKDQKQFARWVNHKAIFKSVTWEEYRK